MRILRQYQGFATLLLDSNFESFPECVTLGYLVYEPSHTVQLMPGNSAGKYRFLAENVLFTGKLSSNIATASNSNLLLYNSYMGAGNPGKGMWSLVGGNNTQEIRQSSVDDPSLTYFAALDVEQNSGAEGYYTDSRFSLLIEDSTIRGNMQFGGHLSATGTQTITIRRSHIYDFAPMCQKADIVIEDNCIISPNGYDDISGYTVLTRAKSLLVQNSTIMIGPYQPEKPWYSGIPGVSLPDILNISLRMSLLKLSEIIRLVGQGVLIIIDMAIATFLLLRHRGS